MATLHIVLTQISRLADTGATPPLADSKIKESQTVTLSGSSQVAAIDAEFEQDDVWEVVAIGGDAWISFGATPDAAVATNRRRLIAGVEKQFNVTDKGEKIAFMSAS